MAALRMVERGHRVLLLEKGRRFRSQDLPRSNWDLPHWMWRPNLGFRGPFQMTFLRHLTALSGVGLGGGSLVYGNVLETPPSAFFQASSWAHLADWKAELGMGYRKAREMLGATPYPAETPADALLKTLAGDLEWGEDLRPAEVGVHFGEPGVTVSDPYFGGAGPDRAGCRHCGGCMVGCRFNAKNTLDLNYLYLAEAGGLKILDETEVTSIRPRGGSYEVHAREGLPGLWKGRPLRRFRARRVILAAGVLGTVPLLLRMREDTDGLPRLSSQLGRFVRTNSEVLMGVVDGQREMSEGVAITSLLKVDEKSCLEPVRFSRGSGVFRLLMAPHAPGPTLGRRLAGTLGAFLRRPLPVFRAFFVPDFGKHGLILLFMRASEGHLRLALKGTGARIRSEAGEGPLPQVAIPEATALGRRLEAATEGFLGSLLTETLFGIPTTAHILGGCVMGDSPETGVIGPNHEVWNYPGLYVMDGSTVSANPGVNPSLTIAAMAERAAAAME